MKIGALLSVAVLLAAANLPASKAGTVKTVAPVTSPPPPKTKPKLAAAAAAEAKAEPDVDAEGEADEKADTLEEAEGAVDPSLNAQWLVNTKPDMGKNNTAKVNKLRTLKVETPVVEEEDDEVVEETEIGTAVQNPKDKTKKEDKVVKEKVNGKATAPGQQAKVNKVPGPQLKTIGKVNAPEPQVKSAANAAVKPKPTTSVKAPPPVKVQPTPKTKTVKGAVTA